MAGCFFAADLDENPLSTSNWMKFGLLVSPRLIPVFGQEANMGHIGSKIGWDAKINKVHETLNCFDEVLKPNPDYEP